METTMNRHPLHVAIAAALLGALALAGCKKRDETATTPTPAVTEPAATTPPAESPAPAPGATTAPATMTVSTVELGSAIGTDNRVTTPMTSFAKADTIHASVATDGAGGNLTAKWTMGDQVVDTQQKTVAAGPQVTEFSISKPDGWPAGRYTLQVLLDGNVVQTRDFDVK
jgi:hypothetical protein